MATLVTVGTILPRLDGDRLGAAEATPAIFRAEQFLAETKEGDL
jgi:hypothetical protein